MNPKHLSVRMDQADGELWLTEEKFAQRPRRIKKITGDVILALAAEIIAVDDTRSASREVRFSDGAVIRITVEEIRNERHDSNPPERDGSEAEGLHRHEPGEREPDAGQS